ncbi:MAG TPA: cupin domain-containing protein [Sphingomicrobium sp.]|nr:cupin domain-containing protein [Sphingomicrobium sp.]
MTADELIERLELAPHPEGGWYRETWRSPAEPGMRAAATAVYYVIQPGQHSHWNRVDADEMWLWHSGDPLDLSISATGEGPIRTARLGGRIDDGEEPQVIVPAGHWQSAASAKGGEAGYTFLSCIVAPAFEFDGYELAKEDWSPARGG